MARKPTTEVANWDEELAKHADTAAAMEKNAGGGQFFSTAGGRLSFDGADMPGNQMAVVVVDSILEHVFYEGKYDPNNPIPPTCFAFGREDDEGLVPHEEVLKLKQNPGPSCGKCPNGEWASADTGRGRACRWTRRLGLIPAGNIDAKGVFTAFEDPEHFAKAQVTYLKLPVTSVKGYAGYVKQISSALRRPPFGVFTKIQLEPDPKNQFRVTFDALEQVPNTVIAQVMARNTEVRGLIEFPYNLERMDAKPAVAPARRGRKY